MRIRSPSRRPLAAGILASTFFEQAANFCAQFGGGFFSESDHQDFLNRAGSGQNKIENQMLNRMSLAGAGARFDNCMLMVRDLLQNRGPVVTELLQALRIPENRFQNAEALLENAFYGFRVGRFKAPGVPNGPEIRTAGHKIVVANIFIDQIGKSPPPVSISLKAASTASIGRK